MTVGELEQRMTYRELVEWLVVFKLEQEAHEKALRESASKARGRR